uniref:Uncharacterized protein n=1 Tax=Timema monikensis TaxID=170555 RepID=A0A7R9E208_9NEOP|nr:unnamed protein product [Timema monikensis]
MTSNAIRGIRRKKSTLSEVKVAVVGAPAVGKSGLKIDLVMTQKMALLMTSAWFLFLHGIGTSDTRHIFSPEKQRSINVSVLFKSSSHPMNNS